MTTLQTERHPVDRLAEEFVQRYRRGERPAISEYVEKYPELAGELQELLAAMVLIEEHGRAQLQLGSSGQRVADRPAPVQLGEYRVLREIGRGGMGVVYEAVQESLGRHVALKVLPSHKLLDPVRLKRFQHEAQAAARLHHTNIVPIFGVGMAESVHFYAMQFIQGRGLDEVIEELRASRRKDSAGRSPAANDNGGAADGDTTMVHPSLSSMSDTPRYYRSVASLGAQVAEALDHAHRQGVLHRDIKPSNLLLDSAGTVWITDFGLAKTEGTEELTHSGDLVGTLRYMAPEQLRGKADGRADIYSLGSTLYELLTLRPAFDAPDRPALVRQIVQDDPLRPRRFDARIPCDLETIVLKAMTHNPASRYSSAAAMAADLRRFLDDKPITARRMGVGERLWRWCVRRPALASLAAALLLSLSIGILGVLWEWARAETHLKEAVKHKANAENSLIAAQQEQRRAEEQQRRAEQEAEEAARQRTIAERKAKEAEASYQTARKAVDELTMVSENALLAQPGLQSVRLQLLTRAVKFYEEQLAGGHHDPVVRRDLATSYLRLGAIKSDLGPAAEAPEAYRKAIALLTPLDGKGENDPVVTLLLARAENRLGLDQIYAHDLSAGRVMLDQARERLERLLAATPNDRAAQAYLAMTFNNLGHLLSRHERCEEAIELHQQALTINRRLAARDPKNLSAQSGVSSVLSNLGRRHQSLGRHDEARSLFEECLRIRQQALHAQPANLTYQRDVAQTLNALGDVIRDSRLRTPERLRQAVDHYEQSREMQQRLVQQNPAVLLYQQDLGNTLANLAELYLRYGDAARALEWHRQEFTVWNACLTLDPGKAENRALYALGMNGQAAAEEKLGMYAESLNSRRRSREMWREVQNHPQLFAHYRANLLVNLADLMIELAKQERIDELCALAGERRELAGNKPADLMALSYDLERAFRAVRRGPRLSEQQAAKIAEYQQLAVQRFREAAKAAPREMEAFVRSRPNLPAYIPLARVDAKLEVAPLNTSFLVERARLLRKLGDEPASRKDEEETLRLIENTLATDPENVAALRDRATLYFNAERWEQATASCAQGLEVAPSDYVLLRIKARASQRREQWPEVYDACSRILKIRPDEVFFWSPNCRAAWELGHSDEALANARTLIELTEKNPKNADFVIWEFLKLRDVGRFSETALAVAQQAAKRHSKDKDNVYRGELGVVQCCLGQYQEAIDNLQPAAVESPSVSSALTGFYLAMSHYHLGEPDKAQAAFIRAVRNWKGMGPAYPDEEDLTRSLWLEAQTLLGGSVTQGEPHAS